MIKNGGSDEMNDPSTLKAVEKRFSELLIGDRIRTIAKVTNIKSDEKNDIPKWHLVYLFDGSKTIRIFLNDISTYNIGDYLELEFTVKEGKPWNGNPQLAFDLHYVSKSDKPFKEEAHKEEPFISKSKPIQKPKNGTVEILRKEELKNIEIDESVKFYTRILTLFPKDGTREKNQKILLVDLENKPVSLWLPKSELPVFKIIKDGEYFVVNATVKKTHDNPFLVFNSLIRGDEARNSNVAQKFIDERIKYYSHELEKYLKLKFDTNAEYSMLESTLKSFNKQIYGE
ncbi:MAG: hypothetical protein EAX96_05920 [Candidatus Lokiarchaeota archaeon]|nr:hypothetical protein [Candidatus Lokiarchaeota archaeon]